MHSKNSMKASLTTLNCKSVSQKLNSYLQQSLVQNKVIKPCWSLNLIYRILHLLLWPNLFILQPTSTCLFYLFTSASDVPCPCSSPASAQVFPFTPFFYCVVRTFLGVEFLDKSLIASERHSCSFQTMISLPILCTTFTGLWQKLPGSLFFFSVLKSTASPT